MCHGAASTAIPAGGSLLHGPGTQVIPGSKFTAVSRNREQGQQEKGTARGRIKAGIGALWEGKNLTGEREGGKK